MQVGPWKFQKPDFRRSPGDLRILVPVNGQPASDHAFRWACQLARQQRARLHALYIFEIPLAFPLEADENESDLTQSEAILKRMENIAAAERYSVNGLNVRARTAGPAIIHEAVERRIDLLVLGLSDPPGAAIRPFGHTTDYILKYAPCQVLLSREPQADMAAADR